MICFRDWVGSRDLTCHAIGFDGGKTWIFHGHSHSLNRLPYQGEKPPGETGCSALVGKLGYINFINQF